MYNNQSKIYKGVEWTAVRADGQLLGDKMGIF